MKETGLLQYVRSDFSSSIIVFFVALPLCLGIALASGAPLFAGIIAGIIGGIVVGALSGSKLGVSGPAAGLAVIVFEAIRTLGSYELFLVAVVLAGVFQLLLGYVRAGFVAYFFPSSVINGMLSGIGLLIILKQLPYLFGWHADFLGEEAFIQANGENTFSAIEHAIETFSPYVTGIAVASLGLLILWDSVLTKKHKLFTVLQGPIAVVAVGIGASVFLSSIGKPLDSSQLVLLPELRSLSSLANEMHFPAFSQMFQLEVFYVAAVMAIVASIETLLCVEATDKLDPKKSVTPANRELKAQGVGNVLSGLVGGLPITQVIVRSSANIAFGAQSKLSAILHGFWLFFAAWLLAPLMNKIPLAALAAILVLVGYKLAKPSVFIKMYHNGKEQFIPFVVTIVAMVLTDLLTGVLCGLAVSVLFTLQHSYRNSYHFSDVVTEDNVPTHRIVMAEEVSFFNKPSILKKLNSIPRNTKVILDFSKSKSVAYDVKELVSDFVASAASKGITVETVMFQPLEQ